MPSKGATVTTTNAKTNAIRIATSPDFTTTVWCSPGLRRQPDRWDSTHHPDRKRRPSQYRLLEAGLPSHL
jgi:hypothetical protein